jgi:hypothetical protein
MTKNQEYGMCAENRQQQQQRQLLLLACLQGLPALAHPPIEQ